MSTTEFIITPAETTDTRATALRLIDFLKQKVTELDTARESAEERVRQLTKELADIKESWDELVKKMNLQLNG
jgi:prefoldin subunit 5